MRRNVKILILTLDRPFNFRKNTKSFCSKVFGEIITKKSASDPDFVNSYLKKNNYLINNDMKIKVKDSKLSKIIIHDKNNIIFTEETNKSIDVIHNKC